MSTPICQDGAISVNDTAFIRFKFSLIDLDLPRPVTTDIVARRMIAGALGVRAKKKTREEMDQDMYKINAVIGINHYNIGSKESKERDAERRKKLLDNAWNS